MSAPGSWLSEKSRGVRSNNDITTALIAMAPRSPNRFPRAVMTMTAMPTPMSLLQLLPEQRGRGPLRRVRPGDRRADGGAAGRRALERVNAQCARKDGRDLRAGPRNHPRPWTFVVRGARAAGAIVRAAGAGAGPH